MGRVEGKVAIVTGGALGIGRATAQLLAREGAMVAVTDVKDDEGRAAVATITEAGGTAQFWHLDVSQGAEVQRVVDTIADTFGGIDVLVNNAGILGTNKPTHELDEAEWDEVMNVNAKGVFLCTKFAIPYLQQGGGSIINLSSIAGLVGGPDVPPYRASKGAIRLMSKTDAMLYAEENIRVNSVHPGAIRTAMIEDYLKAQSDEGAARDQLAAQHPLGHVGAPDDIAYGILYLASDESKFVTGAELVIDGGYTAR
ncbi:MAG: glucose 1-dehydrogenase [Bacteroidetes bacterium]|jgi:NAD(P)-dependent dehydrogenase (short-subunit alcohol dehydrogenase family)|nr:glucose 1-dehydrogenase [Bacteroidota bacterium]